MRIIHESSLPRHNGSRLARDIFLRHLVKKSCHHFGVIALICGILHLLRGIDVGNLGDLLLQLFKFLLPVDVFELQFFDFFFAHIIFVLEEARVSDDFFVVLMGLLLPILVVVLGLPNRLKAGVADILSVDFLVEGGLHLVVVGVDLLDVRVDAQFTELGLEQ